jgi:opacity protein-like surface antigen
MIRWLVASAALVLGLASAAAAQDTDQLRFYVQGRAGIQFLPSTELIKGVEASNWNDGFGGTIGVNLNRYVGFEVAVDVFEPTLSFADNSPLLPGRRLVEYSTLTVIPQIRLRYPLLGGRLTPYAIAGVGWGHTELTDRKPVGFGVTLKGDDDTVVGTVGAGVEYFVANNIAVGVEAKYQFFGDLDLEAGPLAGKARPNGLLTMASVRVLWPEAQFPDRPPAAVAPARDSTGLRFYAQIRALAAVFPDRSLISGVEAGSVDNGWGFTIGLNVNRYLSVEIAGEATETDVSFSEGPNKGKFGEYAFFTGIAQAKFRYPLLDGALVPYVLGGVGLSVSEFNDRTARVSEGQVQANDAAVAGALGVGVDYFVANNIAVGAEAKYTISGGHDFDVRGVSSGKARPNPLFLGIGLRLLFPDFWRTGA